MNGQFHAAAGVYSDVSTPFLVLSAFVDCATDFGCASDTIRSYMNRFGKDCNGDQLVTCEDYMMLHKNGGWNCGKSLAGSEFWKKYTECRDVVIRSGDNI